MSKHDHDPMQVMRLNITLVRDEHPELFAELEKLGKGLKRIQRFKTLASERLLLQGRLGVAGDAASTSGSSTGLARVGAGDEMAAALELFLPPVK